MQVGNPISAIGFPKGHTRNYYHPSRGTAPATDKQSHSSIYDMYIIQNDAISRLEGDWLRAMTSALGEEFFQSVTNQTISLLTILAGALTLDAPIPPFLRIPRAALFRVLMTEREPEEMSLKHVGETGYAVFAAMSVSSQFADQEVERCLGLVRSLVGEVDLLWDNESM